MGTSDNGRARKRRVTDHLVAQAIAFLAVSALPAADAGAQRVIGDPPGAAVSAGDSASPSNRPFVPPIGSDGLRDFEPAARVATDTAANTAALARSSKRPNTLSMLLPGSARLLSGLSGVRPATAVAPWGGGLERRPALARTAVSTPAGMLLAHDAAIVSGLPLNLSRPLVRFGSGPQVSRRETYGGRVTLAASAIAVETLAVSTRRGEVGASLGAEQWATCRHYSATVRRDALFSGFVRWHPRLLPGTLVEPVLGVTLAARRMLPAAPFRSHLPAFDQRALVPSPTRFSIGVGGGADALVTVMKGVAAIGSVRVHILNRQESGNVTMEWQGGRVAYHLGAGVQWRF